MFIWPFAGDYHETRLARVAQMPVGLVLAATVWFVILVIAGVLP
jgi:hypothetical protein